MYAIRLSDSVAQPARFVHSTARSLRGAIREARKYAEGVLLGGTVTVLERCEPSADYPSGWAPVRTARVSGRAIRFAACA